MYTYKVFGHPSVPTAKVAAYLRKWFKLGLHEAMDLARELAQRPVEVLLAGQPLEGWGTKPPMLPGDKPPFSIIAEAPDEGTSEPPEVCSPDAHKVFPTLVTAPLVSTQPISFPSGVLFLESSQAVISAVPVKALESAFTTCQTCQFFGHLSHLCWRTVPWEQKELDDRCDEWALNPDYQGEPP